MAPAPFCCWPGVGSSGADGCRHTGWSCWPRSATSAAFLASYLYYHAHVGHVHFQGHGWSRPLYFSILLSHTILAVIIVPLIVVTLSRALRARYALHKAIARWTFPLWMYVSVTGVVVYLMLYKLFV